MGFRFCFRSRGKSKLEEKKKMKMIETSNVILDFFIDSSG